MFEQHFAKLGFTERESQVFMALGRVGKTTAQGLSKRTGLARSTVYSALEALEEKGVVSSEEHRQTTFFVAKDPSCLQRIVEDERAALEEKERLAEELFEHLHSHFRPKVYNLPLFRFVEGKEKVGNMLTDVLDRWRIQSGHGERIIWGYQDHTFTEQYGRYLKYRWKTRPKDELIRIFSNKTRIEEKLKKRPLGRFIKIAPRGAEFASNMWIFGDVLFLAGTREEPHYGVAIQDEVLAENAKTIFEWLWNLMPE